MCCFPEPRLQPYADSSSDELIIALECQECGGTCHPLADDIDEFVCEECGCQHHYTEVPESAHRFKEWGWWDL